ncbi:response regulator [Paenibacillus sp. LMG 31456]|uniref:Response regulator n=1 Tax=Paenibacillus foliorum TaxID=2654974 RepID=A0A972GTQ5_9BACL|nr:response regulator [Paenibacillus foliorum]NOU96709.1 response regulator [Paenibacillus foliorum]
MYKIMLVEDEDLIRQGLKKLIEEVIGGFIVVKEEKNGRQALESMKSILPDLIITDIRMKEMNGIEMIEQVRHNFPDTPILVISGYGDFEYVKKALRFKVEDYLLKPVDRVELTQYLTGLKARLDSRKMNALQSQSHTAGNSVEENEKSIIRKVREIIHSNLDQDISLQFIANKVHMNHQYLSSLFKLETGQNFVDYVIQCRMERAKQLLQEANLKIYEVAKLSGYENSKYFMTVFKQLVGVTPSDFRENQVH